MHGIDPTGEFDIPIGSPSVSGDGITNGAIVTDTSFVMPPTGRLDEMIGVVSERTTHPAHEATAARDEAFDAARAAPRAIAAA